VKTKSDSLPRKVEVSHTPGPFRPRRESTGEWVGPKAGRKNLS